MAVGRSEGLVGDASGVSPYEDDLGSMLFNFYMVPSTIYLLHTLEDEPHRVVELLLFTLFLSLLMIFEKSLLDGRCWGSF